MHLERHSVSLTTDASGDVTGYTPAVTGRVLGVIYTKTDFTDGVDITVSTETTLQTVVTLTNQNSSVKVYPRSPVQDETGANALHAAGGTSLRDAIYAVSERIKVVVAQGGNAKTGAVTVIVG